MHFLFVSQSGLSAGVAWRVREEGHAVRFTQPNPPRSSIGDGFLEKVSSWEESADWADTIIFDDTLGHGTHASALRERGLAVIGGTPYTDRLEDEKTFGQLELARHGATVLPVHSFASRGEAEAFIQAEHRALVLKPMGTAQNMKSLLYVGHRPDGSDCRDALRRFDAEVGSALYPLQLQERVTGVEVAVGAFFNGTDFLFPFNLNFEHKRLFPGDIGPITGEMGTSMLWVMESPLFDRTLKRLESQLREENYRGYIDVNCIVNEHGIYPLEFTCRFGYPTILIQMESLRGSIAELLGGLARGESPAITPTSRFHVGIRGCVPPYPLAPRISFPGYGWGAPIRFLGQSREGISFEDAMLVDGEWQVAGVDGVPIVATGSGDTMRSAQAQALSRIRQVDVHEMYYRNDIGARWETDGPNLVRWGYLDGSVLL